MATKTQFIVDVSRYATGGDEGSSYSQVLRIELLDTHLAAAKTTFSELKQRFPAGNGFKLELIRRETQTTSVATYQ